MSRRPENLLILSENPCFEGSDRGTTLIATFSSRSIVVAKPLSVGLNVHPPLKPLPARSRAKSSFLSVIVTSCVALLLFCASAALASTAPTRSTTTASRSQSDGLGETRTVVQSGTVHPTTIITQKPNVLGETKSRVLDSKGSPIQTIVAQKPNYAGEVRAVVKDNFGQPIGRISTSPPNVFGETRSIITDAQGRRVGEAVARKPNVFGEVRTIYKDASGQTTGQSVTTKPNVFGEVKARVQGRASIEALASETAR